MIDDLIRTLKLRVGAEWGGYRAVVSDLVHREDSFYWPTPAPDHDHEWQAIRLLTFAANRGSLDCLTQRQLAIIRTHVTIPPSLLDDYTPPVTFRNGGNRRGTRQAA